MGIFLLLLPPPLCKCNPSHLVTSLLFILSFSFPSFSPPLPPSICVCSFSPVTHTLTLTNQRSLCFPVGLFMGFSCEHVLDEEQSEIHSTGETTATQQRSLALMEVHHHQQQQGVENEADFWPVEHPLEPRDEDRPVKCPMPQSSVINDGGMHEKRFTDSIRKRAEASAEMAESEGERERRVAREEEPPDPARAVRKRHHALTHGEDLEITPIIRTPPLPPLPSQNVTIFQMLQQVDKFDS